MKITGRRDYLVSLESVSMTDIVLNMFIFFFISFSLLYTFNPLRTKKLDVKLPAATSATTMKYTNQVYVTVTNESLLYLDKELVTKKELKDKVYVLHKNNPQLIAVLRADKLVRFKDIVSVLDILNDLGIRNLNIATTTEE